jgi:hypothetical protein
VRLQLRQGPGISSCRFDQQASIAAAVAPA